MSFDYLILILNSNLAKMTLAPLFFLSTTFQGQWVTTANRFVNDAVRLAVLPEGYDVLVRLAILRCTTIFGILFLQGCEPCTFMFITNSIPRLATRR